MTVKEFYYFVGGDYEDAINRFRDDSRIYRYLSMFLKDTTYSDLVKELNNGNVEEAFRYAHTMKGLCQNLSFVELYKVSFKMTELLRAKELEKSLIYLPEVTNAYRKVVEGIMEIKQ